MKKVVYTVLLGKYKLQEPVFINNDWSFICFTNQNLKSDNWEIVKINGGRKKSREIKIKSHEFFNYDICLYLDSKFIVKQNLNKFIKRNLKTNLSLMKHNKRKCLYKEGEFCIKIRNDNTETILKQLSYYKSLGVPENMGLFAPGIMIKKNVKQVNEFMNLWYEQVEKYSYRDQISFPYILWKNPINLHLMEFKQTYAEFS